jgi:hypothetical protein
MPTQEGEPQCQRKRASLNADARGRALTPTQEGEGEPGMPLREGSHKPGMPPQEVPIEGIRRDHWL